MKIFLSYKMGFNIDSTILPPLYELDSYLNCIQDDSNQYCHVQAKLDVSKNEDVKNIIQNLSDNKLTFDRTFIHKGICTPKDIIENISTSHIYLTKLVNQKIGNFNLTAEVHDVTCLRVKEQMTIYDQLCLIILVLYSSFILYATYECYRRNHINEKDCQTSLSRISLVHTWKKRTTIPGNEDYYKLLSMQGVRVFSLLIIIFGHTIFTYNLSFVENPTEYEEILSHPFSKLICLLSIFIVLTFFLLSSWLLTSQVYNIFEKNGNLSFKHIGILILNRYFRLVVIMAVLLILMRTSWLVKLAGPVNFSPMVLNQQACNKNWIYSLLFISNFHHLFDICHPVSWYTSADFQLYVVNVAILYMKFKFKFKEIPFYGTILACACVVHGILLYIYEADVMYIPTLRNLEQRHLKRSTLYVVSYMSTISIWSSSFIGIIIGDIYYKTKNAVIKKSWLLTSVWALAFSLLPSTALFLSSSGLSGYKAAILGSLVKPMYTLGIGLGILGLSHNIGGPVKKLLEWEYVVILSNFVYCVYLIHSGVIITVNSYSFSPLHLDGWKMAQDYIVIVVFSFTCGIFVTLGIEEPGVMLQKKYLPQVNKWVKKANIN